MMVSVKIYNAEKVDEILGKMPYRMHEFFVDGKRYYMTIENSRDEEYEQAICQICGQTKCNHNYNLGEAFIKEIEDYVNVYTDDED